MKTLLLDLGEGLAGAVKVVFGLALLLIPVSAGVYRILLRKGGVPALAAMGAIATTIVLAMLLLYVVSLTIGAEPFESLFDPALLSTAFVASTLAMLVVAVLAIVHLIKRM